jgi:putative ABC transport system permease protein
MRAGDLLIFSAGAVTGHRLRSFLTGLGIAVGIAAVVLLTSIGEGIHRFVLSEFTQFGTNLIAVVPGKTETFGTSPATITNVRPLSLTDAEALARVDGVRAVAAVVQGNAVAESERRSRRTMVLGVGPDAPQVWNMAVAMGRFLPQDDQSAARAYAVLGSKLRVELFGDANPLGQRVRVGGDRYRIVGVMESKGQFLGFDLDDGIYIPVGKALELFDRESLMEIDLLYGATVSAEKLAARISKLLVRRHGDEDFTLVTQQQMLDVLGSVLDVLTFAVAALGGISLFVGGVGILTIMTIAVTERTGEIGLLRAIGAQRHQVLAVFLAEALLLAGAGGITGLILGLGLAEILALALPELPVHPSWEYSSLAVGLALVIGLAAGVWPARRAAALAPVNALRAE